MNQELEWNLQVAAGGRIILLRNILIAALALTFNFCFLPPSSFGQSSLWAKPGRAFPTSCFSDSLRDCSPIRIPSPDKRAFVDVKYRKVSLENGDFLMESFLVLTQTDRSTREDGTVGLVQAELLWAPDSSKFLVTGSDGGEGPFHIAVYNLSGPSADNLNVSGVQRDMLQTFHPCKAKDADPKDCKLLEENPRYINVVAVGWARGSSAIALMAEVPCCGRFGGIAGQVLGYEVDASSGKILERMGANEFAERWQHNLAWKFETPEPPEYRTKPSSTPD